MAVKSFSRTLKNLMVATVVVAVLTAVLASVAFANVRVRVPPDPYAPIYADWYGNDEWVAFIFYRDPWCVPDDFNILDFFDPNAYGCSLTVRGFVIYKNPGDFVPVQAKLKGLGKVPIWFVSVEDYESATEDDVLTMGELEGLESLLIGCASFYKETLHPEGHPTMPMKNIVAYGTLENDSGSFRLHALWVGPWPDAVNINVNIVFW